MGVRLSDAIVPSVFFPYMLKETMTKSAIFESGILRQDANFSAKLAGGGRTFDSPFWKDLDDTESDAASDDPDDDAVAGGITSAKDIARRQVRTRGWSSARLVAELAGSDPAKAIAMRVAAYWRRQFQSILVNTLRGVFNDNVDNDSSDMVSDIGTDSAGAATSDELVSADAVLDARQTLGDAFNELSVIFMHSVVYTRLNKQNLIDFIPNSDGAINFPTYLGYRVVVDDGCPAIAGSNRTKYWTFLIGTDALGWAEVPVAQPVSTDNDESKAGGMGIDELWTRRQFVLHPYGVKWTDTSVTGEFPTNTELRDATNWDRVVSERKQVSMALLITNG